MEGMKELERTKEWEGIEVSLRLQRAYNTVNGSACQAEGVYTMASRYIHLKGALTNDHGTWTIRTQYNDPDTGKRKQHSKSTGLKVDGHNKRKAEAMIRETVAEWERQVNNGRPAPGQKFSNYVSEWLERKRLELRQNTYESYCIMANSHIIPELGTLKVTELTYRSIQLYYERMREAGLSANTLRKHRVIIRGALNDAVLNGVILTNPADSVRIQKGKRFVGKALSDGQMELVNKKLKDLPEPMRAVITLALHCALRRSEICGLRWCDIDFENRVISIQNTVQQYSGLVYEEEATKTDGSNRTLHLTDDLFAYLVDLKATQEREGLTGGKVCAHPDGHPLRPEYVTRASRKFLESCGLAGFRLHDIRHAMASIMIRNNVPIPQVMDFLGHKNVQTTLGVYTHVMNAEKIATADFVAGYLGRMGFSYSETYSESPESPTKRGMSPSNLLEDCSANKENSPKS